MAKNIVLLSDGTGNSASNLFKSNVWRLYQALNLKPDPADPRQPKQIAYHDDGVGTASFKPLALIGGAFGWGLQRNVLDLYCFLCRHYCAGEPGENDRIYAFGFSRGAFTIRVLAGLILSQGLVQTVPDKKGQPQPVSESERRRLAKEAYRRFRDENYQRMWLRVFRPVRNWFYRAKDRLLGRRPYELKHNTGVNEANEIELEIEFLGLWDTVAAYGLPIDELTRAWNFIFPLAFPDRNLDKRVNRACHALALDDERLSFHPELWNEEDEKPDKICKLADRQPTLGDIAKERISQVWFAGMHSNVGGSYPDDGMSFVPLDWMMEQAKARGLEFDRNECRKIKAAANPYGKMYDSRRGFGGFYRYKPRKLDELTDDVRSRKDRLKIDLPKIHESVFQRIKHGVDGYAPIGLPEEYVVVTAGSEIVPLAQAAHTNPHQVEGAQQARERRKQQEAGWNRVWLKRQVYLFSVAMALLLALMPYYRLPLGDWTWAGSFIDPLIAFVVPPLLYVVGKLAPGMFSAWIEAFQAHPNYFSFFTALFLLAMWYGDRLQRRIFDGTRSLWRAVFAQPGAEVNETSEPKGLLYRYRSNKPIQSVVRWVKEKLIPALLLPVLLLLGYGLCHRVIYLFENSAGYVCRASSVTQPELEAGTFINKNLCWASGVKVKKGLRYRLTMTVNEKNQNKEENWMDSSIPTGIHGFKVESHVKSWVSKLFMYATQPLRRLPDEDWFKPIARIGSARGDEFPLTPVDGATDPSGRSLTAEFTASRDDELFLFVNDFVTPIPRWQPFYDNNEGEASVTIKQVK